MNIDKILKELTLEEKASLCSGSDFWHTEEIKRLDIPSIMVSDGPHGLRKMRDDTDNPNEAIKAVCFPCACALACSFDRKLLTTLGKALGEECQAVKQDKGLPRSIQSFCRKVVNVLCYSQGQV